MVTGGCWVNDKGGKLRSVDTLSKKIRRTVTIDRQPGKSNSLRVSENIENVLSQNAQIDSSDLTWNWWGLRGFESQVSSIKNERIWCFLLIQLKLDTRVLILETRHSIEHNTRNWHSPIDCAQNNSSRSPAQAYQRICVNKHCLTLFNHKTLCCSRLLFLCSVISQGKTVALDRWGGKWNQLSIIRRLTTDYAKNYCNRTLIVQVIVENVVTFFLRHIVYNYKKIFR